MCSREGLLDFKNEEYVVFSLLSGQGSAFLPPAILEYLSTGDKLAVQPGTNVSPASDPVDKSIEPVCFSS